MKQELNQFNSLTNAPDEVNVINFKEVKPTDISKGNGPKIPNDFL